MAGRVQLLENISEYYYQMVVVTCPLCQHVYVVGDIQHNWWFQTHIISAALYGHNRYQALVQVPATVLNNSFA